MDIELPSSAIAVLRVTYDSVFSKQKLPYKDRRKLWKKLKRKKARIINHFAILKLRCGDSLLHESPDSDSNKDDSNLPDGPLTNSAIIQHLKSLESNRNTEVVGILRNSIKPPECTPISLYGPEPAAQVVRECDSSTDFSNKQNLNEDKKGTEVPLKCEATRPADETNEITRLLAELDDEVERWQNPSPPSGYQSPSKENEATVGLPQMSTVDIMSSQTIDDNRPLCSFYSKTGACRFGIRCSKKHESISSSDTLVFLNMFNTFIFDLEDRLRVAGDVHDLSLEHSEQDLCKEFAEFYFEIQPEFCKIGRISHLYVCRNRCHHLRGNLYVQYLSKDDAKACFDKMNGRYFGSKPLVCSYVNISSWAGTLCGIDMRTGQCSRGGQCNYLHIFRNPKSKKCDYSEYASRERSPHVSRRKHSNEKQSSSNSRLNSKISSHSPNAHYRSHKNGLKHARRHSRRKRSRSRSMSSDSGAESEDIISRSHCRKSYMMAIRTSENLKHPSSNDVRSPAEFDEKDWKKKRRKKSKKRKKKDKKD